MRNLLFIILISNLLLACQSKREYVTIIEFETTDSTFVDQLIEYCEDEGIPADIYCWKNHVAYYAEDQLNKSIILDGIKSCFNNISYKIYDTPYYVFDKRDDCENKTIAAKWSHTIMTCNLVKDTLLQSEYMDYHTRQRELFPEVAQGFCNANFQQLLCFRNGRQIMLVISIPEGKTLDELNSKTTENNPRVDEWNSMMANYQEGIEGTDENEIWVELKKNM